MGSASVQAQFVAVRRGSPATPLRRPLFFLTVDSARTVRAVKCSALISKSEMGKDSSGKKSFSKASAKKGKRVKAVTLDTSISSTATATLPDLNYDEVAETLENIYKSSPDEDNEGQIGDLNLGGTRLVRGKRRKMRRLSVEERAELKKEKDEQRMKEDYEDDQLLRSDNTALGNNKNYYLDWKRMKIPPVLKSADHTKLFKIMQPMKAIKELKESLQIDLKREPTERELAVRMNMTVRQMRRHIEVGRAARHKLIKHNLRLVLYVMNKYFAEYATADKFDDMCQAGVMGLMTAVDRFQTKKGFRLSTYGLFWIRHSIIRSLTTTSFTRYPFAFESAKHEIQKAKLSLLLELNRPPSEEEIAESVGMTIQRYRDVMKATRPVYSLNSKHPVTQEELIDRISDDLTDRFNREPDVLRLALDDVLDSLKPKESIVIRQRYGLDGKGERSLIQIAGNLNISKEMARKHELKAFMKLRHPTRLDYLRTYL